MRGQWREGWDERVISIAAFAAFYCPSNEGMADNVVGGAYEQIWLA
jgi:hypothetical protein